MHVTYFLTLLMFMFVDKHENVSFSTVQNTWLQATCTWYDTNLKMQATYVHVEA